MVTQTAKEVVHNPNHDIVDRPRLGLNDSEGSIDVFEVSSTKIWPLGTRYQRGLKVYYYTGFGATEIAAGRLCQMPVIEANGDHSNMAVDTPGIGTTQLEVTNGSNTAIAEDEFAGGELTVRDDTGEAYSYTIKGNDAIAVSAAGTIFLWDKIQVALGASATVDLTHIPYRLAIIHPSPPTALLVGVTVRVATASYYGWLQTWGPCAVLHDGTTTAVAQGQDVRASEDDDGAVAIRNLDEAGRDESEVGVAMHPSADAEHTLVFLKIMP